MKKEGKKREEQEKKVGAIPFSPFSYKANVSTRSLRARLAGRPSRATKFYLTFDENYSCETRQENARVSGAVLSAGACSGRAARRPDSRDGTFKGTVESVGLESRGESSPPLSQVARHGASREFIREVRAERAGRRAKNKKRERESCCDLARSKCSCVT